MTSLSDELYHFGVKGMRWGVIRTPEQLGHGKSGSDSYQRYKDKKIKKIDKVYKKAFEEADKALAINPKDSRTKKQVKELKRLYQSDVDKIKAMTYLDVQSEKRAIAARRKQTAAKAAVTTVKTAGAVSLWGLRMGLAGVKIYGTLKAAQFIGQMGMKAVEWLQTDEGVKTAVRVGAAANSYVQAGDAWLNNNSDLLNSIQTTQLNSPADLLDIVKNIKT